MKVIDAKGLACPQPVILTFQQIKKEDEDFDVLVDDEASRENVIRLLKKYEKRFSLEKSGKETIFHIKK